MKTRAKFKCNSVSKSTGWGDHQFIYTADFSVVMGNSEENKTFFASTPTGTIKMGTIKEDHFEVGKEYFIDFTIAE